MQRTTFPRTVLFWTIILAVFASATTLPAQTAPYVRTIIVSPVPGSPTSSGDALIEALASVSPTSSDRWLLKIEPGIYDVGTNYLQMKSWLDVEGSGVLQTEIRGAGQTGVFSFGEGVVKGAGNSELRNLTVSCISSEESVGCIAVANVNTSPLFTHVKVTASGTGTDSRWGFRNTGASPLLNHVDVEVSDGYDTYGVVNADYGSTASKPTIMNSTIQAKNGSNYNNGILNKDASGPRLVQNTEVRGMGGSVAAGMRGMEYSGPVTIKLREAVLIASGGATNYGVLNGYYTLKVDNSSIRGWTPNGHGIYLPLGGTVQLSNSDVVGDTYLVVADNVYIGGTRLRSGGSIVGYSVEVCAGVYDGNYVFYASTCP